MDCRQTDSLPSQDRIPDVLGHLRHLPRPVYGQERALPNQAIARPHRHPWVQFSYALQGVIEVRTRDGRFMAPPQQAVWVPATIEHGVRCSPDALIRSLYIEPSVLKNAPAECKVVAVNSLLRELIRSFSALPVLYGEHGPESRLVAVLLDELAAAPDSGLILPWPRDERLQALCSSLQSEPGSQTRLYDFAARYDVSEKTLTRLFRQETGLSFRAWRQRLRIMSALPLLERQERVTDVALACGYDSMSAFVASFRELMGETPGEFLRAAASSNAGL
ncbi:AraC family transcriptional regulator [Alcaligenes endophyticus]|uniref:Helix-turn-helix transcriptional regulator n=1 Tax=Alcaligenes endophyticus TaxID=1929088 RepID=A0ABT8EKF9_9BURK|nr:helix-turn-helix transcriptional regulator [Alcaligenes endophyticus]MCX5591977.1 helix-turn-helix transcriptional regulator [Alcaligenes endophyticus]MDN4121667.1 helix-turn-helix transcriptional regulator [Alcaligenes endophyticus]